MSAEFQQNMSAFHLPEMADQTCQSVNQICHFEGWCCNIMKDSHSENGIRYFEESRRTSTKLIPKNGALRLQTARTVRTNRNRPCKQRAKFVGITVCCTVQGRIQKKKTERGNPPPLPHPPTSTQ